MVMFEGTGPSSANVVTDHRVILERQEPSLNFIIIDAEPCSEAAMPIAIGPPEDGMTLQCSVDAASEQTNYVVL